MSTLDPEVWLHNVSKDLIAANKYDWILDLDGSAVAGENVPPKTDTDGYVAWLREYMAVKIILEQCLGPCLEAVLKNPRYRTLEKYARMLDRVAAIQQCLVDNNAVPLLDLCDYNLGQWT